MISKEKLTQKLSIWGFVSRPLKKKRKEIITFRAASCFAGRRQKGKDAATNRLDKRRGERKPLLAQRRRRRKYP